MMGKFNDEFDGVGGSYLFDPATGKRTRIDESASAEPAPVAGDASAETKTLIEEVSHVV
jgi:hypothetical protein